MANLFFNYAKKEIIDGTIVLLTDTIKIMLLNTVYTPNADDTFIDTGGASDAVDARLSGTTDQTLGTKVINVDLTGDFAYFDAADALFTAVTTAQTAAAALVYKSTGTPTTSRPICYLDITDTPTNGGDITLQFAAPASGAVFKLA